MILPKASPVAVTIIAVSLLLSLAISPASAGVSQADSPALVRIDITPEVDLSALGDGTIEIYARLYGPDGAMILLLPADQDEHERLVHLGFSPQILDHDPHNAAYYLLYGSQNTLEAAGAGARRPPRQPDDLTVLEP